MSQIWKLVGPDGKPYTSAVPGTLGGHRRNRIYGRLDCPSALRAIAGGGTGSSSSPKNTHGPPGTVPAPSASPWHTHAGKHSRPTGRGAGQFLREDGDFLYEPFKKDWWNDATLATHHRSEGGTR